MCTLLCEGVQSILVWQNEKKQHVELESHSEEDIRISQSELFFWRQIREN